MIFYMKYIIIFIAGVIFCVVISNFHRVQFFEDPKIESDRKLVEKYYMNARKCYKTICKTEFHKNDSCKRTILGRIDAPTFEMDGNIKSYETALTYQTAKNIEILAYARSMENKLRTSSYSGSVCGGPVVNNIDVNQIRDDFDRESQK